MPPCRKQLFDISYCIYRSVLACGTLDGFQHLLP